MGKSDAEMEDAEKPPSDLGDNVQEPGTIGAQVESKQEIVPSEAGHANGCANGSNDSAEFGDGANDKPSIASEMEEQGDPTTETGDESLNVGPVGELTNAESENECAKTDADKQIGAESAAEDQNNPKLELVEQNASFGVANEDKSVENGVEGGNHVKSNMEEKPSEDKADEIAKEFGREDAGSVEDVAKEGKTAENAQVGSDPSENVLLPTDEPDDKDLQSQNAAVDEIQQGEGKDMENVADVNKDKAVKDEPKEQVKEIFLASPITDGNSAIVETSAEHKGDDSSHTNQHEAATPSSLVRYSPSEAGDHSGQRVNVFTQATPYLMGEGDDGTPEDQAAFMKEIETFYRERAMDFKPPKFYGQPLNCLKLWRAVIRLGGYDRVTGAKLWRQVGESFHPPKTCTTVSWTFRIFYEKSLLEYERHKRQIGELQLPAVTLPEVSSVDNEGNGYQGSGPGRARRDAAARAMQGWHAQRLFGDGEGAEQAIKDKNLNNMPKREKSLKSIGSLKQKRANEVENSVKVARIETSKQLMPSVIDVGPPADWVKINIRQTKDCFEVYALVPGLLREEVRVQSDPAGRLVITGQPEQLDNPWGITPFKKVVSLPARIDPLQTSAVVSLHGRLFVRVPFEQSTNI